jgi:hypothetical protein
MVQQVPLALHPLQVGLRGEVAPEPVLLQHRVLVVHRREPLLLLRVLVAQVPQLVHQPQVRRAPVAVLAGVEQQSMTPYGRARREAYTKLTAGTDESPGNSCVGTGMPGSIQGAGGYPMEIMQRPEQINITFEAHNEVRRVFIGDRNAAPADRIPSRSGYSEGKWEGNTLVITTDNLVDQVDQSYPHSDQAVVVERWTMEGKDAQGRRIMLVEMTMTDPKFYTEPVKLTKRFAEVPNGRILPYECTAETWYDRVEALAKKAGVPHPFEP